ncbi:hypothetical protein [Halomonas sp. I5-271120]|uniref:hypothetical protein n=1 Tax=Halomonas sp. I5-271120 TaxID=3061632 RepID=UPI002714EAE7|nr:hypothetical protein [Halomonas sp. I5-271120]
MNNAINAIPSVEIAQGPQHEYAGHFAGLVEKAEPAIHRIGELIDEGYTLSCACSFGKDSSVVLVLMLEAIRRRVEAGLYVPTCYVSHSNTEVENPAMDVYTNAQIVDLQAYCERHHLPVEVVYVTPSLSSSFTYATIGRGKLPIFAGASRACSIDWKLRPQQKALKHILSTLQNPGDLVTLLGTRFSESTVRGGNMRGRGDGGMALVPTDSGGYTCAVIADWELTDVWEMLVACDEKRQGPYRTYVSDFSWCLELYKDANEGMCSIITGDGGNRAACGSRHGCMTCCATGDRDKSMESMIASGPSKHGHLEGINQFRNFLIQTRWDMSRREILGRKVSKAGYFGVAPTNYSAEMRRDMLRYLLTLDVLEEERAEEHDAAMFRGDVSDEGLEMIQSLRGPTYQVITPKKLLAIEFAWSLSHGFDHAFPALSIWYEIRVLGERYPIPPMDTVQKAGVPSMCWFKIPEGEGPAHEAGLQDALIAKSNLSQYPERPPMRTVRDRYEGKPRQIVYYEEADEMEVDAAEATLFVEAFDEERYLASKSFRSWESAKILLNHGLVTLGRGKASDYDELARRAQYWDRLQQRLGTQGLEEYLQEQSISDADHNRLLEELEQQQEESEPQAGQVIDLFG